MNCVEVREQRTGERVWLAGGSGHVRCIQQHCCICAIHIDDGQVCDSCLCGVKRQVDQLCAIHTRWVEPLPALPHQQSMAWQSLIYYHKRPVNQANGRPPAPTPAQLVGWWADIWRDYDGEPLRVERNGSLVAPYNYLADNVERVGSRHPGFKLFVHDLRYGIEWLDHQWWNPDPAASCVHVPQPSCPLYERSKHANWFYLWHARYVDTLSFPKQPTVRCHGVVVSKDSTTLEVDHAGHAPVSR